MITHAMFLDSKELAKVFMDLAKQALDGKIHLESISVDLERGSFSHHCIGKRIAIKLVG